MQNAQNARKFVKLTKIVNIKFDDSTADIAQRWQAYVRNTPYADCYTLDMHDTAAVKQFSADDFEFADVQCYIFTEWDWEHELFVAVNWLTVRERATGDVYAYAGDTQTCKRTLGDWMQLGK